MRLAKQNVGGRITARLSRLVPVACLHALAACTTDVDIFRPHEGRPAISAAGSRPASDTPNSQDVLVERAPADPSGDMNCRAGHYVGTFNGTYNSAAWDNGSRALTVAATPSLGRPGLEFWLERIPRNCREDEEFCADFTVKGGKIRGNANPFSGLGAAGSGGSPLELAIRFEIDFGGELDCSRGKYLGLLQNGCYDVATVLFRFNGDAPADYDATTSSFTNGRWTVTELPADGAWIQPDPNIGGMGTWQATWVDDDTGPAAESVGLCGPPPGP